MVSALEAIELLLRKVRALGLDADVDNLFSAMARTKGHKLYIVDNTVKGGLA